MSVLYSETQIIRTLDRLTRSQLTTFIKAEIVTPVQTESGPAFREIDRARLELLCDLTEEFDLNEDALGMIMSLLDQLHTVRNDLRKVLSAIEQEPSDIRRRIARKLIDKYEN